MQKKIKQLYMTIIPNYKFIKYVVTVKGLFNSRIAHDTQVSYTGIKNNIKQVTVAFTNEQYVQFTIDSKKNFLKASCSAWLKPRLLISALISCIALVDIFSIRISSEEERIRERWKKTWGIYMKSIVAQIDLTHQLISYAMT